MKQESSKGESRSPEPAHLKGTVRAFAFVALIPFICALVIQNIFFMGKISPPVALFLIVFAVSWWSFRYFGKIPETVVWKRLIAPANMVSFLWGVCAYLALNQLLSLSDLFVSFVPVLALTVAIAVRVLLAFGPTSSYSIGLFFWGVSFSALAISTWISSKHWIYRFNSESVRLMGGDVLGASELSTRSQDKGLLFAKSLPKQNLAQGKMEPARWSYDGLTGPAYWSSLSLDFSRCSSGKFQSPIDIPRRSPLSQEKLRIRWQSEQARIQSDKSLTQIEMQGNSKAILNGEVFTLKKVTLHSPSEHQLSGLTFPMEAQLFMESAAGRLAAFGVFVEIGSKHSETDKIIEKLAASGSAQRAIDSFNARSFLPTSLDHYQYQGSLTSPPCSEGVAWYVFNGAIEMSSNQISGLRALLGENARPVQAIGSRTFDGPNTNLSH